MDSLNDSVIDLLRDKTREPTNAQEAKEIVDYICRARGYIDGRDELEIRATSVRFQDTFRLQREEVRELYARYTKTVASEVYSSRFRCIQEILQNSDDAEYPASETKPRLTFRIRPTEIIIDSNETGFTRANVEAICSTGVSSKEEDRNTTGEKGLGFKSVFGIAHSVHIQSGCWSFRFEHPSTKTSRKEDGLGMIMPIWTEPESSLPDNVRTRFSLKYLENSATFVKKVREEFERLPDTTIFALRALRELRIVFEQFEENSSGDYEHKGSSGKHSNSVFNKEEEEVDAHHSSRRFDVKCQNYAILFEKPDGLNALHDGHVRILTWLNTDGKWREQHETKVRVFSDLVQNLPTDNLRSDTSSKVVVGLQVHPTNGRPIIPKHGQQIFAFLAIERLAQLPFLIQADFRLSANRESIFDTKRNERLREAVAEVFASAVAQLCRNKDDALAYRWMRYLPKFYIPGFWRPLASAIKVLLSKLPVLFSQCGNLRLSSSVRIVPSIFQHEGKPLFDDIADDVYLSDIYEDSDIDMLRTLQVAYLDNAEMITRIRNDISNDSSLHFGASSPDPSWFSSFAMLANDLIRDKEAYERLSKLQIIPVSEGKWVSIYSMRKNPVYLPICINDGSSLGGNLVRIEIPNGLGLQKLRTELAQDSDLKLLAFYAAIGIRSCEPASIVSKIIQCQKKQVTPPSFDDGLAHMEILFWYNDLEPDLNQTFAIDWRRKWRKSSKLYFRSREPYDTEMLVEGVDPENFIGFSFLHNRYVKSTVRSHIRHGLTWTEFLEKTGIRYYPELGSHLNQMKLNEALVQMNEHNPQKFVANLQAHWADLYSLQAPVLIDELMEILVLCQTGQRKALSQTVLPTSNLLLKSEQLCIRSKLPFVAFPNDVSLDSGASWEFLEEFGVICGLSLDFYLIALGAVVETCFADQDEIGGIETILDVFTNIYEGIVLSSKHEDKARVKAVFTKKSYIFVVENQLTMRFPDECVWEGPSFLQETPVLQDYYGDIPELEELFLNFLHVKNATYKHVNDDLLALQEKHPNGLPQDVDAQMPQYYAGLSELANTESSIRETRDLFEEKGLVHGCGRWRRLSDCVWDSPIELHQDTITLELLYPSLRNFFVEKLGVKMMSANVLTERLLVACRTTHEGTDEIKRLIKALGQILARERQDSIEARNLKELKRVAFLPVCGKTGHRLCSTRDNFYIVDHEPYGTAFKGEVDMLDYSLEDLTDLHPLLSLLGLDRQYLSNHVKFTTDIRVGRSVQSKKLTEHLRCRSYVLSCLAVTLHSTKFASKRVYVHTLLSAAKVYICDEIKTYLLIEAPAAQVKVESDRAFVKIEIQDQNLAIYAPSDKAGLDQCYSTTLLSELEKVLGIEHASKQLYRVLNDEKIGLDRIMEQENISHFDWLPRSASLPEETVDYGAAMEQRNEPVAQQESQPSLYTITAGLLGDRRTLPRVTRENHEPAAQQGVQSSLFTTSAGLVGAETATTGTTNRPPARLFPHDNASIQRAGLESAYRSLLLSVVRKARPHIEQGIFEFSSLFESLDASTESNLRRHLGLGLHGQYNFEDNARIGAAGELYVYERLKAGGFNDFGLDNWQSRIRGHVSSHPDYSGLENWSKREVADFMYKTGSGGVARALDPECAYDFSELISSGSIEYLIEIKTTTGPCNTAFYVSSEQYELMRKYSMQEIGTRGRTERVYLIVRVYNLFGDIGVKVYVDPWQLRDTELRFSANKYTVVPI